jgi:lipoic acid synthetase
MSNFVQIDPPSEGGVKRPKPEWLRVRYRQTPELDRLFGLVSELRLNTVCSSAACPNLPECWSRGTATFMLGGNLCTRRCHFCDVATGRPDPLDPEEPERVAEAIRMLGLRFAVLTAVARDDLSGRGTDSGLQGSGGRPAHGSRSGSAGSEP